MEEEKKDNKKAGMKRALNVRDILNKKYDVFAICSANGVTDKRDIDNVIKEASTCDFDLRRVRKSIHKVKRMTGE